MYHTKCIWLVVASLALLLGFVTGDTQTSFAAILAITIASLLQQSAVPHPRQGPIPANEVTRRALSIDVTHIFKPLLFTISLLTLALAATAHAASDTTRPTVSLTAPTPGTTVSDSVTVSAKASDNVRVAGVQFKLDGVNLGNEDTKAPYALSWNTTTATDGAHTLTAVARDAAGNRTTSKGVTATVKNATPFNFSLTASPVSVSVIQGSTVTTSLAANLTSGTAQFVAFSAAGLPTDAAAAFSSPSCTPTCSSTLTITTTASTPAGTSTFTVTGIAGELSKTASVTLTVEASAPPVGTLPPIPQGIFAMLPQGPPDKSPELLAKPSVSGIVLQANWPTIETNEGTYNLTNVNTVIAKAEAAQKHITLALTSGGENTPEWVYDLDVQTFSYVDTNTYHDTYGQVVSIPAFWDPVFLQKKIDFIRAMGERFASHPAVKMVYASCVNAHSPDWNMPSSTEDVANWKAIGYTSEKIIDACQQVLDATMAAFPNQYVSLAVGRNGSLDPWPRAEGSKSDPDYVARAVVDNANISYPGRLIVTKMSLSATTPDPALTDNLNSWQLVYDNQPLSATQMVWFVTGDSTCRMNGRTPPCDPVTMLRTAIYTGLNYGTRYQEIYGNDILNPDLAGVIAEAATLLQQ